MTDNTDRARPAEFPPITDAPGYADIFAIIADAVEVSAQPALTAAQILNATAAILLSVVGPERTVGLLRTAADAVPTEAETGATGQRMARGGGLEPGTVDRGTGRGTSKTINAPKKSFGQSFLTEEKMNTKQVDKLIRRRAEALIPATLPAGRSFAGCRRRACHAMNRPRWRRRRSCDLR